MEHKQKIDKTDNVLEMISRGIEQKRFTKRQKYIIVLAMALTFMAGSLFGFGLGAKTQYDVSTAWMIGHANTGNPIIINGQSYELQKIKANDKITLPGNYTEVKPW